MALIGSWVYGENEGFGGQDTFLTDISADGSLIVGTAVHGADYSKEAVLFTGDGEFVRWLGKLNGVDTGSHRISANGEFVVGGSTSTNGFAPTAFFWSNATGMLDLGDGPWVGGASYHLWDTISVSNNGIVVGSNNQRPFIWDIENGRRSLEDELQHWGIDLDGWRLTNVVDISADGHTLLGTAYKENVGGEAFVVSNLPKLIVNAADYNDDGIVDAADYTVWRDTMGEEVTPRSGADGDADGYIGLHGLRSLDITLWVVRRGRVRGRRHPRTHHPATSPLGHGSRTASSAVRVILRHTSKGCASFASEGEKLALAGETG